MSATGRHEREYGATGRHEREYGEGTPSSVQHTLRTHANLEAPDEVYQQLVDAHRDLDASQSALLNARLILLLANHVGDTAVLTQAIAAAREGLAGAATDREAAQPEGNGERPTP